MQKLVRRIGQAAVVAAALLLAIGVTPAGADDVESSGSGDGILSGNSAAIDVDAPVTLCGLLNGLGVGGIGVGAAFCGGPAPATGPSQAQSSAEGDGIGTGNSLALDLDVPVRVECVLNGIGVLGVGVGGCVAPNPPSCSTPCPPPTTCCPPPTTCCVPPTTCCRRTTTTTSTTTSSTTSSTTTPTSTPPPPPPPPELAKTGSDFGLEVPLGLGLVAGGALCVWASRRRLSRLDRIGR